MQEITGKSLADRVKLPENLNETTDFYISNDKILDDQKFNEESFSSFNKAHKALLGEEIRILYKDFMRLRGKALNGFKNSEKPDKYISQVFSENGVSTI